MNAFDWKIDRIETCWYRSGKFSRTYIEVTFWYSPVSCTRRETKRSFTAEGLEALPDWALTIKTRNRSLENY
ncbi:hypothetical protein [Chryseobacterium sp. NFX27]|uniref:hypothetical protein n=1 Tax=Chryseobacterium sp. NFX27 TaxID=2819618 RepID=UPI003CF4B3E7